MKKVRGRYWVAVWLVFALLVMITIVTRQTSALVAADNLRTLQENRRVLESEKNELMRRIRAGRSRSQLVPRARALGLRAAVDSEVVDLEMTTPEGQ